MRVYERGLTYGDLTADVQVTHPRSYLKLVLHN